MAKIKNRFLSVIIWAIFFVIWNVLVFVIPDLSTAKANFWCPYVFTAIAFILVAVLMCYFKLSKNVIFNVLAPVYIVAGAYMAITLIMNTIFMCFPTGENLKASLIPNIVLLLLFVAAEIVVYMAYSHIKGDSEKTYAKVRSLRTLAVSVSSLEYLAKDSEVKSKVKALAEAVKYSDPMGVEETAEAEDELKAQIEVVKTLLNAEADKDAALSAIAKADALLKTRNELLRAVK